MLVVGLTRSEFERSCPLTGIELAGYVEDGVVMAQIDVELYRHDRRLPLLVASSILPLDNPDGRLLIDGVAQTDTLLFQFQGRRTERIFGRRIVGISAELNRCAQELLRRAVDLDG